MTFAPDTLLDWRTYMKGATGLSAVELGITGGPSHVAQGTSYHLGKDQLQLWRNPYSARHPRDVAGLSNAASASDTGWFPRLVELTAWAVNEARAGRRPDTAELIGPGDNGRAYRWAADNNWVAQLRPDGDSHETHLHEGWRRDSEHRDKVQYYRPFFEGKGQEVINKTDFDVMAWRTEALFNNRDRSVGGPLAGEPNALHAKLNELKLPVLSDEQLVRLTELMAARMPSVEQIAEATAEIVARKLAARLEE